MTEREHSNAASNCDGCTPEWCYCAGAYDDRALAREQPRLHGESCRCEFCAMLRKGWTIIAPDGTVFRG